MNVRDRLRSLRSQMTRVPDRATRDAIKTAIEALEAMERWIIELEGRIRELGQDAES